jgi:ribosomal protein S27E
MTHAFEPGIEMPSQAEQDEMENAPGGTAMHSYRHEIDCPRCGEGALVLATAETYVCCYCGKCYQAHNNRPIL